MIILPNNKNIILAANQAKEVTVKQVAVVPSRTIPQGLAAMLRSNPDGELEAVAEKMTKAMDHVHTGEITDRHPLGGDRRREGGRGQVIALLNGKLVVSAGSVEEACLHSWKKRTRRNMN